MIEAGTLEFFWNEETDTEELVRDIYIAMRKQFFHERCELIGHLSNSAK